MKLEPIVQQLQSRIRFHGKAAAFWRQQGLSIPAEIERIHRREAVRDLTRVLRMAEQEATDAAKAIQQTLLDRLPF